LLGNQPGSPVALIERAVRPERPSPPLSKSVRNDAGFTLAEVLVALVVSAVTAAALAGLFVVAARAAALARLRSSMAVLAVQKMEQLRALTWSFDPWSTGVPVSDTTSDVSRDPVSAGGPGLQESPPDSLDRNTPGFVDFLDAGGRWVGAGATVPASAVFVRRWRVRPAAGDPETLVLQVIVTSAAADAAFGEAVLNARGLLSTGLTVLRTRKTP
jgi:prepilin-type N-terminal cleavage/methylation domain-containing protein